MPLLYATSIFDTASCYQVAMTDWPPYYASRASHIEASEIREFFTLLERPDIITFAGGIPDPRLFPVAEIAEACRHILLDPAKTAQALQYSLSEGYLPLREWVAGHMGELGVPCGPDNILITNGAQQALDFLGKLFINPGDVVLVARPTYLGALQAFNAYEPTFDVLPGSGHNRTIESYRGNGKRRPKIGYAMPDFQNPTGLSLTQDERLALLDAVDALDFPLIEDIAYETLRYDGAPIPSLAALVTARVGGIEKSRVISCGTFSKSIAPGLRTGWIAAPRDLIKKLVLIKQSSDLNASCFNQMIVHEVASAIHDRHTADIRNVYRVRRDAMLKALAAHMPKGVHWTKPEGGMFVWVTFPDTVDGAALLRRAIDEIKVAFVPGEAFFADRSDRNTGRFGFTFNEPAKIEDGIQRLGALLSRP
jgi:DNA-binding transcriptional MocR family regulator